MNTAILVLYIVVGGHMNTMKLPQESIEQCESARTEIGKKLGAVHAECKVKAAPKSKK